MTNALADQPIDNYYMIEAEGTINLGPAYGTVRVVGMTIDEIKQAIDRKLHEIAPQPGGIGATGPGLAGPSRSRANTWSVPTARSTSANTAWSTWPA